MVRVDLTYAGELRTHAQHAPSRAELSTDAPVDNAGRGESFSPTDLLATALGSCMLTVMGIAAETRGWSLAGAHASVQKHMVADPKRRVGRLDVQIHLPESLDTHARELLEQSARTCPVAQSIHPSIELDLRFSYR